VGPSLRVSDVIKSGSFARIVEIFPPGLPAPGSIRPGQQIDLAVRFERIVESIRQLEAVADAFSLPELRDGSRIHLNSVSVAAELKRRTTSSIIPTITLRDSNRQNLLGTIAFAIYSGVENIQIVRGDPYETSGALPKNVYDISKIAALVTIIREVESHLTNAQKTCILAPLNLTKISDPDYLKIARQREASGIDLFVTESLFEETSKYLDRVILAREKGISIPIIHNIFPFRSYEDAVSCAKNFGWKISEEELHGLKINGTKFGLETARKRYSDLVDRKEISQGACISTRGSTEIVRQIVY
jgi:5,10-methylenetetrahydrofolate reductase